jgi:hypothetical protein
VIDVIGFMPMLLPVFRPQVGAWLIYVPRATSLAPCQAEQDDHGRHHNHPRQEYGEGHELKNVKEGCQHNLPPQGLAKAPHWRDVAQSAVFAISQTNGVVTPTNLQVDRFIVDRV